MASKGMLAQIFNFLELHCLHGWLPPHSDPLVEYPLLIFHILEILIFNLANGKLYWYPSMANVQKWSLQKHFIKMKNKKYFKLTLKIMHIFPCNSSATPKLFPSLSNILNLSWSASNGPQCYHSYKFFYPFHKRHFSLMKHHHLKA